MVEIKEVKGGENLNDVKITTKPFRDYKEYKLYEIKTLDGVKHDALIDMFNKYKERTNKKYRGEIIGTVTTYKDKYVRVGVETITIDPERTYLYYDLGPFIEADSGAFIVISREEVERLKSKYGNRVIFMPRGLKKLDEAELIEKGKLICIDVLVGQLIKAHLEDTTMVTDLTEDALATLSFEEINTDKTDEEEESK